MGSQLKCIVDELNLLYPGKHYNVIAFDSFNADQFLQVLTNVLTTIEAKEEIDIRDENRDQTIRRIISSLHILKYKPSSSELDVAQALLLGDKMFILPILEWLLQQRILLEKRAYLAKFLIKIEVPNILRGEMALEELYENYEQLIEAFKSAHRERELLLSNETKTSELRGDLSVMEREKEIVTSKIASHQKSRVDGSKTASALLSKVQLLRETRNKRDTLLDHKTHLEATCAELERFVTRTKQQLSEARRAAQGVTPQGLLQRAVEEKRVSVYIAQEKLPADIQVMQGQLEVLRQVTAQSNLSRSDLVIVEQEVRSLSSEVSALLDRRMAAAGPAEDKLAPFRQQAAMLGRRKEAAAEALGALKREAANLRTELYELQRRLAETEGSVGAVLSEDQFRAYVVQLRARTELYKARRGQLQSQAAECGVLSRTLEILKARQDAALRVLTAEEARLGLSGFTVAASQLEEVSATKAQLDTQKEQSLEALSRTILELNQIITSKKSNLAPAIQELRPLREQYHAALADYNKAKQLFDTTAANLGTTTTKLEQDVQQLEEDAKQAISKTVLTKARLDVANLQKQSLAQEIALYAGGLSVDKSKSIREQLNNKIVEEERKSRQLKEAQRQIREQEPHNEKQVQLWEGVRRLFEAKAEWLKQLKLDTVQVQRERGVETLVLN